MDIIAVVKSAGDCATIVSSKTQKELKKRDLVIVDKSLTEVNLTLWGGQAENYSEAANPIIVIKGARVSDYNGVSLNSGFQSVIQFNPDLPQSHELKGWYSTEGASASTNSLSTSGGQGGAGAGANLKSFGEAKKENVGLNDKPDYYSNTARVTLITKDKALYQGCPNMNDGKSCNKKVQDQGDGTYRCEKCSSSSPSFNWRMIINMAMADATDT